MADIKSRIPLMPQAPGVDPLAVDWTRIDTNLDYEGKKIVLPADPSMMPIRTAIDTLERIEEQENQKFDVTEVVNAAPWDALVAIYRAMQDLYGVVLAESIKTFFGEIKPDFVTVVTGPTEKDRIQVPMGQMSLPGVSEPVQIGIFPAGAYIKGVVRKKDRARLIEIARRAKEFLKTDSVYRGRAIRIGVDEKGNLNMNQQPEFMYLDHVKPSDAIHTAETEAAIRTNIFSPLMHTQACRDNKIPLKRGILLEGKYGTGKSLTARVTAKVATDNGWTFIVLDRAQGLKAAIEFARVYQPCVIFAEDIDRAADREEEKVNDLVNLIDGVISKDMEIMVVLTTNFIEKIDRALLRPGRLDAVISIQSPDSETAVRLIRFYARNLINGDVDLKEVGDVLSGNIPATIREVVERAKLSMLMESRTYLNKDDLLTSALGMKRHLELLNPKVETDTPADKLFNAFKAMVAEATGTEEIDQSVIDQIERIDDHTEATYNIVDRTEDNLSEVAKNVKATAGVAQMAKDAAVALSGPVDKIKKAVGAK